MAIVKVSSSGKAVLFIDDDGNIFCAAKSFITGLLASTDHQKFILLSRLPDKADQSRFKPSPVFGKSLDPLAEVKVQTDGLSNKGRSEQQLAKNYDDKKIW